MKKSYKTLGILSMSALLLQSLIGMDLRASEQESTDPMASTTNGSFIEETSTLPETSESFNWSQEDSSTSYQSTNDSVREEEASTSSIETESPVTTSTSEPAQTSESITETTSETNSTQSTTDSIDGSSESTTSQSSESIEQSTTNNSTESQTDATSPAESQENASTTEESRTDASSSDSSHHRTEESTPNQSVSKPSVQPAIDLPKLSEIILDNAWSDPTIHEAFKVSQVGKDNLSGFELPLLTSFSHVNQGVIVYEMIKTIGLTLTDKQVADFFITTIEPLFETKLEDIEKQTIPAKERRIGDLFQRVIDGEITQQGLYLGNDLYVALEKIDENEYQPKVQRWLLMEEDMLQVTRVYQMPLTTVGKAVLADYPASMPVKSNEVTQHFINQIAEDAQTIGQEFDVFASVMIAQAILESGGGTSQLASTPYHNLFGIKGSYQGQSVTFSTNENRGDGSLFEIQSAFRAYPNPATSLMDYVQLIRGGIVGNSAYYEDAWRTNAQNYLRATHSLTGKYATDTTYHKKLNSLIAAYHLTKYDQPKTLPIGEFIATIGEVPAAYRELMTLPVYDGKNYNHSGSYPIGECTWYAFNRVAQLGMSVDDFMGNGGEWGETGKKLGYEVSSAPEVGTLISFAPGTAGSDPRYGHVAFVEAIGPEGVLISEGNVYEGLAVSYRVISHELATSTAVTYVTPKR